MSNKDNSFFKSTCDNDTLFYIFQSNPNHGFAIDRKILSKPWEFYNTETKKKERDPFNTYYHRIIMKRLVTDHCFTIFYKNNNGNWVDYRKLRNVFPNVMIAESAVLYEKDYIIDPQILPACTFHDRDNIIHEIDICDGKPKGMSTVPIEIDQYGHSEIDKHNSHLNKVLIEQCKIDDDTLSFKERHMMRDIKLTLPVGREKNDFLVWLNGAMQPTISDTEIHKNGFKNVAYIKDGLAYVKPYKISQKEGAPVTPANDMYATVIENPEYDEYRYDWSRRLFGWKDIKISEWYRPNSYYSKKLIQLGKSIDICDGVKFDVPVNKDAHLVICNGIILSPDEYYIDSIDPKVVHFTKTIDNARRLIEYYSILFEKNNTFYENINVIEFLKPVLLSKVYSLVNFSHIDDKKSVQLVRSKASATNHPYMYEITFPRIDNGDLVLIDGVFTPYEWIHEHTIYYPNFHDLFRKEMRSMTPNNVERLHFLIK